MGSRGRRERSPVAGLEIVRARSIVRSGVNTGRLVGEKGNQDGVTGRCSQRSCDRVLRRGASPNGPLSSPPNIQQRSHLNIHQLPVTASRKPIQEHDQPATISPRARRKPALARRLLYRLMVPIFKMARGYTLEIPPLRRLSAPSRPTVVQPKTHRSDSYET